MFDRQARAHRLLHRHGRRAPRRRLRAGAPVADRGARGRAQRFGQVDLRGRTRDRPAADAGRAGRARQAGARTSRRARCSACSITNAAAFGLVDDGRHGLAHRRGRASRSAAASAASEGASASPATMSLVLRHRHRRRPLPARDRRRKRRPLLGPARRRRQLRRRHVDRVPPAPDGSRRSLAATSSGPSPRRATCCAITATSCRSAPRSVVEPAAGRSRPEGVGATRSRPAGPATTPRARRGSKRLRTFGKPAADDIAPMPYVDSQQDSSSDARARPASTYAKNGFIGSLSDDGIDLDARRLPAHAGPVLPVLRPRRRRLLAHGRAMRRHSRTAVT